MRSLLPTVSGTGIREQDPLKQGLKRPPIPSSLNPISQQIREQDPLKQGLKHAALTLEKIYNTIREQDPLKQGLKQNFFSLGSACLLDSRARSIKTRIETLNDEKKLIVLTQFASKIH